MFKEMMPKDQDFCTNQPITTLPWTLGHTSRLNEDSACEPQLKAAAGREVNPFCTDYFPSI